MNSFEEQAFFEQYGWERNYVQRTWTAPDGTVLHINQVVSLSQSQEGEVRLQTFIRLHGEEGRWSDD